MKSHLSIQKGGTKLPSTINKKFKRKQRKQFSVVEYVDEILKGNRVVLSQAITLVESNKMEHQAMAQEIIKGCLPYSGKSMRVGITGTPGVGKSTFVEAIGEHITGHGKKLAILAIDPTSQISHGSILGDKTRMERLSNNQNAFIRPSAAGESLGGVARKTRETIILCEAAGYDVIFVETVGVGQSEVAVHSMVDFFLLLLLPGAGDELQGIKRGVVEMADIIAINKADGDNLEKAKHSRNAYRNGLHLFPPKNSGWTAKAMVCSALTDMGMTELWAAINQYQLFTTKNGYFQEHRNEQGQYWLNESIQNELKTRFENHPAIQENLKKIKTEVQNGVITPFAGATVLMQLFLES